ncbi:MAG: DUF2281 domain-containing protein [Leptolyngbyaceae cyanobacterium MO_188.B28]|nr:DUF2281 domain-containing protein [Leptolyngbyaceae cyanobacterium MO_188.B28]
MSTAEIVYELVKTLPEEQANMVLAFAEFLRQKVQPELSQETPVPNHSTWSEQVRALAGAWPDFPAREQLYQGLGQDVERETL